MATLFGTVYGAVAGYFGGWVDATMMRITDAALAIPAMFLLVVVAAIITPSKGILILIIAAVAWLSPPAWCAARRCRCATASTYRRCG